MGEHLDCPRGTHTAHSGEGWRSTRIPHLTPITQGPRADHPVLSARLMSLLPSLQSSKSMPSDGPSPPKYVSALRWRWDEQWPECTIWGGCQQILDRGPEMTRWPAGSEQRGSHNNMTETNKNIYTQKNIRENRQIGAPQISRLTQLEQDKVKDPTQK